MAYVGLRYCVFAPIKSHTRGSEIVYDPGKEIGMTVTADVTITRSNSALQANDIEAESDSGISGAQVAIALDNLTLEDEGLILGLKTGTIGEGQDARTSYDDVDGVGPLGGFGYIRVMSKTDQVTQKTKVSYIANWWFKARAHIDSEAARTKPSGNVEWQTPSVVFDCKGAYIDASGDASFRRRVTFDTYAEAEAFIKDIAQISA